jgi:hypothetical protein
MTNNDIIKELNDIQDDHRFIEKSIDLIYKIRLDRGPVVEVITIIRYEKPTLFNYLKARFQNNSGLKMLFEVTVDYEVAKKSLGL